MATKGLSKPVCGLYKNNNGTVSYSDPYRADKAVEYGVSWTAGDDNPLYADNEITENDKGAFKSGELTLGTTDLTADMSRKILGAKSNQATYGGEKTAEETVYDEDMKSPYLGFGIIEEHQNNDITQYRAVFFPKVRFNIPEEAATTRGESIEWKTKTIIGKILRSDQNDETYKRPWMMDAWFASESSALEYLEYKCGKGNITETVNSEGGAA